MASTDKRVALIDWSGDTHVSPSATIARLRPGDVFSLSEITAAAGRTLAESYRYGGPDKAIHGSGDGSFGLCDIKDGNGFCVRDRCGVYPLYYTFKPGRFFAFASDIASLLCISGVEGRLNRLKAALFLGGPARDGYDTTLTFYEGIYRLPPSHYLVATPATVRVLPYQRDVFGDDLARACFRELSEEFLRRLRSAVHKRAECAGLLLSGGLKSAAIATLAAPATPNSRKLPCWSFIPVEADGWKWEHRPRPLIESLEQRLQISVRYIRWTDVQGIEEAELYPQQCQQPNWFYIREDEAVAMAEAERAGLSALMTGVGAQWLPIFRRPIGVAWTALRSGDWRSIAINAETGRWRTPREVARILKFDVLKPSLTPSLRQWLGPGYIGHGHPFAGYERRTIVRQSFLAETGASDWLRDRAHRVSRDFRENALSEITRGQLQLHLENWALLGKHHRLEFRYPFLDADVVDFAIGLPASYYLGGNPERIVREAMRNILPEEIRLRRERMPFIIDWPYRKLHRHELQLRRLEALERHPLLSTMVDLALVREAMERFPSADALKQAIATGGTNAALQVVAPDGIPATVDHLWAFARFLDRNGFS